MDERRIAQIVEQVVNQLSGPAGSAPAVLRHGRGAAIGGRGVHPTVEAAVDAATRAFDEFSGLIRVQLGNSFDDLVLDFVSLIMHELADVLSANMNSDQRGELFRARTLRGGGPGAGQSLGHSVRPASLSIPSRIAIGHASALRALIAAGRPAPPRHRAGGWNAALDGARVRDDEKIE